MNIHNLDTGQHQPHDKSHSQSQQNGSDPSMSFLDLLSSDMDFEQAYSMYNNLQTKMAHGTVEELQKVQMLNQQYQTNLTQPTEPVRNEDEFAYGRAQILNGNGIISNYMNKNYSFDMAKDNKPEGEDDFDQFFSNTESNALEKFLDNLTNPNASGDPLQFYINKSQSEGHKRFKQEEDEFNPSFEMHTMKLPQLNKTYHEPNKNIIYPAAQFPPTQHSLPTPNTTRQSSSNSANSSYILDDFKRRANDINGMIITPPTSGDETKTQEDKPQVKRKKKRVTHKPLLSLEQKRLNHSHSEQKRRQLCKLAYQRCLKQIIDLEAFNKLPAISEEQRKSKKARISKDGLPNLSKHNALIRISNEMILIKRLNEELKKLIDKSS
ncbi:uncharacterized protein SPAPADRAFT_60016 [Spathaspora passalidarum NRRL Y-27907]|uniref:Uncharacterized protein n=1 Tax=Spathaspora passalidarum (strain NRRL Y-27907 / 11-Y1) TaxID=619300 RepID=G3AJC7_SPAPN|nr:uncharacterized protein SPAPADRAFT_60016 [Spathaspora passalidarum NRRL Y-27907]EGW34586.1 hypothetical protein SPAPADRAFT_60016 [Spathaspora passalidarum NRRL Y-27907]